MMNIQRFTRPAWLQGGIFLFTFYLSIAIVCASDQMREQQYADQIEETLVIGDAIRLEAGELSFLALYTEADSDTSNAAIILHGLGVHPNWADVIFPLRSGLAEHGWATLSLQMPIGPRDATFDDSLVLLPEAPPRIAAAIAYLHEQGYANIVLLAHSFGAQMAVYYLAQSGGSGITAFVSIGLAAAAAGDLNSSDLMKKISIPMLDVYGSEDFDNVLDTAAVRAETQSVNANYSQLKVAGADHFFSNHDDELLQQVQQWLEPFKR
jgi:alpha/beta superfamily hydrolase